MISLSAINRCTLIVRSRAVVLSVMMVLLSSVAFAASAQVDSTGFGINFDSPHQRALYQQVINELRCLVCQNQTLADSNADLAKDLRRKSYEMIKQNKSYDDIIQYMLERYGEFVLYRPRLTPATLLLWFSPFAILIIIMGFALIRTRNTPNPTHNTFSKAEMDNAKSLIESNLSS